MQPKQLSYRMQPIWSHYARALTRAHSARAHYARALTPVAVPIHALTVVATIPRQLATTIRRRPWFKTLLAKSAYMLVHDEVDRDVKASPTRQCLQMKLIY